MLVHQRVIVLDCHLPSEKIPRGPKSYNVVSSYAQVGSIPRTCPWYMIHGSWLMSPWVTSPNQNRYMVYMPWLLFQVMSNIPKMGQLPTPVIYQHTSTRSSSKSTTKIDSDTIWYLTDLTVKSPWNPIESSSNNHQPPWNPMKSPSNHHQNPLNHHEVAWNHHVKSPFFYSFLGVATPNIHLLVDWFPFLSTVPGFPCTAPAPIASTSRRSQPMAGTMERREPKSACLGCLGVQLIYDIYIYI